MRDAQRAGRFYLKSFAWTTLCLLLAVVLLYPHFCDGVDPDATAYLTLARRWDNADFARAVNGYWSPFSIWLTALLMQAKIPEIPAAFIQNTAGAIAFLGASMLIFRKYNVSARLLHWVLPAFGFFLLHAIFHQWFGDLWGAAFALLALRLLLAETFFQKPGFWVLYGFLTALAYFSKSLCLPFCLFQIFWAALWVKEVPVSRKASAVLITIAALVIVCSPWWLALKSHYGFWTTGVAGSLNLSWGILGHPVFTTAGGAFLPPLFKDSVSFWEDPWWVNAELVHFWDSPALFLHTLPRLGYFALRLLQKSVLVSLFLPIAFFQMTLQFFRNRFQGTGNIKTDLLQATLLFFPLPFLMLHVEARYLWLLAPLTVVFVHRFLLTLFFNRFVAGLLAGSLCVYGMVDFPNLWHLGRAEKRIALQLRSKGISGDFVTDSSVSYAEGLRLAYFSGMRYWPAKSSSPKSMAQLQKEAETQGIPYLLSKYQMLETASGKVVWSNGISGK